MMIPSHPPNPRLVVRVGITGHRPNKLGDAAAAGIRKELPLLFAAIDTVAHEIRSTNSSWYSSEPPTVRLVSSFAQGADQIAVETCPDSWHVEAILPFPFDEYLKDFEELASDDSSSPRTRFTASLKRAHAITQLPFVPFESGERNHTGGDSGRREKGYADAARYLLQQIDLLVAVWDGRAPKTGGTGALVKQAYDEGIPVVWLSTLGDATPHLIGGFDGNSPIKGAADYSKGPLLRALMPIFSVSDASTDWDPRESKPGRRNNFFRENWHGRCYLPVYDFLKRIAAFRTPRLVLQFPDFTERRKAWDKFIDDAPETGEPWRQLDGGDLRGKLKSILLERVIWADSLAEYYAHNYRSAYVLAYLLSAIAVFIALGSETAGASQGLGLAALEFALIIAILVIVLIGRWSNWHERWIEYRALAESLRHGRFLAFVSEFGRIHDTNSRKISPASWILWYIRATMREIGLPTATLDQTYQWRLLQATLIHEIEGRDGQIAYHEENQKVMGRIDHLLHIIGITCFLMTLCFLGLFILGSIEWLTVLTDFKPSLTFWTAGLPALGAALAGIRIQGEFEGSKERSARTLDALTALQGDYTKALTRSLSLRETSDLLISTAHAMSEDLAAWQELYGRKWLSLPS